MKKIFLLLGIFLFLSGCVCPPSDPDELAVYQENNDPFEPMNRGVFKFNMLLDDVLLDPITKTYRFIFPLPVREGILNFFTNLKQPVYFTNALLQGKPSEAGSVLKRFSTNTFLGFLGVFNVANALEIPVHTNDFGQTLAVWGLSSGPYLVLPAIGPSNFRDTAGLGVDSFLAPIDWALKDHPGLIYARLTIDGFAQREKALDLLNSLKASSTDYYATLRSMYRQNRIKKIGQEKKVKKQNYEFDFPEEF